MRTPRSTLNLDRVEVALALAQFQVLAAVLATKAQARCADTTPAAERFTAQSCVEISEGLAQAAVIRQKIVEALRNPKDEFDWQELARIIELLVRIAMKFV